MHIAYLCSRYPAVSHSFIQREITALRALGVRISTISIRRAEPHEVLSRLDREEAERTYSVLPARPLHLLRAHLRALLRSPSAYVGTLRRALSLSPAGARGLLWQVFYFGEAVLVWDRCRAAGATHLHAHFANVGSDVALLAAHLGGWSWSFTMHGSTELYDVPRHRLREKVEDARFVACVSDFTRSQLMLFADPEQWDKLRLVRCAVDTEAFAPPERPERDGPLRVLTVSRLVPGKGNLLLVEAAARAGAELTIVGDGPDRPRLEARARELGVPLRLTGSVSQDEIRDHYAAADAFCLPSFAEGVPVVLMEAMAMGLPVVATRIAGIPELVEDGRSGLLVTPGRVDELARALEWLAADPQPRFELGQAGREAVVRHYDLERNARELLAAFEGRSARSGSATGGTPAMAASATASSERR